MSRQSAKERLISHHAFLHERRHIQDVVASDIRNKEKAMNYQPHDKNIFLLGEKYFNDGVNLNDVSVELRNNQNFIKGFNRAKRIKDVEITLYDMGSQYFLDGLSIEEIPEKYRNNPIVIKGYIDERDKKRKIKVR